MYRRHFLNYGMTQSRYTPVLESGEMLIITYDAFHSAMQPFVDWKIQKGIPTTIVDVSTIGNNSSSIDTYIDDFYASSGGNLCWVLLVGDATQIATPTASKPRAMCPIASSNSIANPTYSSTRWSSEAVTGESIDETVREVEDIILRHLPRTTRTEQEKQ